MTETPLPRGLQLTPLDPVFREDPYPILHDLRRRAPVYFDDETKRVILPSPVAVLRYSELSDDPSESGSPDSRIGV